MSLSISQSLTGKRPAAVVVGTGFGLFTHVRALRDAGFEVRALVGRQAERTAERASRLDIPVAATRLSDVLSDPEIVLVTVATPPHAHYPVVMEAIAAGRHVMCEKPFALDTTQAREMRRAAEAAGVVHALGAEFRFDTAQALLRRVVLDGMIGKPLHFFRIYQQHGLQDPAEVLSDWWEDAAQGGGFLGAFGAHMIDQVRAMLGEFKRVSGVLETLAPGRPRMTADDTYSVQFELESGVQGGIIASTTSPGPIVMATKVAGTHGGAWIQSGPKFGDPEEVWISNADGARRIETPVDLINPPPTPFAMRDMVQTEQDRWHSQGFDVAPYARLFAQMRERIQGQAVTQREPVASFADAVAGQAVLDAIRRSAAERRWVDVERA